MDNYRLYVAVAHVIVLAFRAHWPVDHICIALAYLLAWKHIELAHGCDAVLGKLAKAARQLGTLLRVLRGRLNSVRPTLKVAIDGRRVRLELAW
jgi:hypothetical protein